MPVIISLSLDDKQKTKLLGLLREHKEAFGWSKANIKSINPVDYMHYIRFDENAKHTKKNTTSVKF